MDSASAQQRFLIEKTEEAVRDGLQLEQWCRERDPNLKFFTLNLGKPYKVPNRAEGFFDEVLINGKSRSVMGCRQWCDFGKADVPNAGERLLDFVMSDFLPTAHWTYPDGYPGGFTIEQSLFRTTGGAYGSFPDGTKGCVDWRDLGRSYDWTLLTVYIHDFVMDFGPIRRRLKEAACVSPHFSFRHIVENPSKEFALEVSVGYPFVEVTPIPNVFGFGPGKFGSAVKLYSFFLTHDKQVKVRMYFAAAPRAQRVFDFGPDAFDPVYGGASLLSKLTFGLYKPQKLHDKLDSQMLTTHSQVHQALMEGVHGIWTDWIAKPPAAKAGQV